MASVKIFHGIYGAHGSRPDRPETFLGSPKQPKDDPVALPGT
jgi:hypothetical protein